MQITEEQVSTWTGNPDRFVEDESEDSFSYSVRLAAQDLLLVKPFINFKYVYLFNRYLSFFTFNRLYDKNLRMKLALACVRLSHVTCKKPKSCTLKAIVAFGGKWLKRLYFHSALSKIYSSLSRRKTNCRWI